MNFIVENEFENLEIKCENNSKYYYTCNEFDIHRYLEDYHSIYKLINELYILNAIDFSSKENYLLQLPAYLIYLYLVIDEMSLENKILNLEILHAYQNSVTNVLLPQIKKSPKSSKCYQFAFLKKIRKISWK